MLRIADRLLDILSNKNSPYRDYKQDSNWGFNKAEINIIDGLRMECSLVVSTAALLKTNCLK